jgi:hypothetical protein
VGRTGGADEDSIRRLRRHQLMRNLRGGRDDIPSLGKAGAPPASARSRRAKACGQVCDPKGRPFRQRVIAVCRALPRCDPTPKYRGQHEVASVGICPLRPGPAGDVQRRLVPRRGWECWTLEMAEYLISEGLLEVISNRSAGDGRSLRKPAFSDFQGHFRGHEGGPGRLDVADASLGIGRTFKRGVCCGLSSLWISRDQTGARA